MGAHTLQTPSSVSEPLMVQEGCRKRYDDSAPYAAYLPRSESFIFRFGLVGEVMPLAREGERESPGREQEVKPLRQREGQHFVILARREILEL